MSLEKAGQIWLNYAITKANPGELEAANVFGSFSIQIFFGKIHLI